MADSPAPITREVSLPTVGEVQVKASPGWQNYRTLVWGLIVALAPAAFNWFSHVDWTQFVSPNWAMFLAGTGTLFFRWITNGPMLSNVIVKKI